MKILSKTTIITIASAVTLAGCVTPSTGIKAINSISNTVGKMASGVDEKVCATEDWNAKGYEHALKDSSLLKANNYEEHCGKYGYNFDRTSYMAGYDRGLTEYCTAELGTKRGDSIFDYATPCNNVPVYADAYKEAAKSVAGFEVVTGKDVFGDQPQKPGDPYERQKKLDNANSLAEQMNELSARIQKAQKAGKSWKFDASQFDSKFEPWMARNRAAQVYIKTHPDLKPLEVGELVRVKAYKGFDRSKFE